AISIVGSEKTEIAVAVNTAVAGTSVAGTSTAFTQATNDAAAHLAAAATESIAATSAARATVSNTAPVPVRTPAPATATKPSPVPVRVIEGTERWTPADHPIIDRDVAIPAQATLLIVAGTEVQIATGRSIFVDGTLLIEGDADAPVRLVAQSPIRPSW